MEQQPELQRLDVELERQQLSTELSHRSTRPSFRLGLAYTAVSEAGRQSVPTAGHDALRAEVGLSVPLWRQKNRAAVAQSEALERDLSWRRRAVRNRLVTEIDRAYHDHRDAHRRVSLYRDTLIPKTTESLRSSVIAFSTGKSDFLDLLDTERTLLEFQLSLARARADRLVSLARLERIVGQRLPWTDSLEEALP